MGLDGVQLIMAVEKKFGIDISDDEGWRTRTPRQLCDLVASKVVRGLISEQLGIPPDFDDDADFVRDLKVD